MQTYDNPEGLTFDVLDSAGAAARADEGSDAIAVLLHGFPQTATSWDRVAPILVAGGMRTLAVTQRGYSPGARPEGRRAYTIDALVGDVAALLGEIGRPVHLVGHDWGAVVAWSVAAQHPESVASLTALSVPHPAAFLRSMIRSPQLLRSWYMGAFQVPAVPEIVAARAPWAIDRLLRSAGMDAEMLAASHAEVLDSGAFPYALNWYRALPFADRREIGGRIAVPTAHVWGEGDVALDRAGAEASGEFVDGPYEFHVVAGGGHWLPETAPETVAEIVLGLAGESRGGAGDHAGDAGDAGGAGDDAPGPRG